VTLVAAGWFALVPLLLGWCAWLLWQPTRPAGLQPLALLGSVALLAGALGTGLWQMRPWARQVQILVALPLVCPGFTTLGALVLLGYFTRPQTRACFQGGASGVPCWHSAALGWHESGSAWVVALLVLGVGGCIGWWNAFAQLSLGGFMR
jgi:hypothetical protein